MCYAGTVKIVKEKARENVKTYSVQLRPSVVAKVDIAAKAAGLSRQKVIDAILDHALSDPKFVLRVKE
jgi:hypothetical protein